MRKSSVLTEPLIRWWDFPSAAMIVIAVFISGLRLTTTRWTPDLNYVLNMGILGVVLGLALGKSMFKKRVVMLLSIEYLLVLLPRQLIAGLNKDIDLSERLLSTGNRLLLSISEFVVGQPVKDHLLFVTFLCIVYWLVGLTAGYYFVRHANFLASVLPAGCVMMTIHIYDRSSIEHIWLLAFYLFICLLLLGRHYFLHNRLAWTKRRAHLSTETTQDLSTGMIVGATAIILLAWNLPQVVPFARSVANQWDEISQPWNDFLERMNNAVASVENGGGTQANGYDSRLDLGNSNPLGTQPVFTVLAPKEVFGFPRLYWRGRLYDKFENGHWVDSSFRTNPFSPVTQKLNIPDTQQRSEIEFSYNVVVDEQSMLYVPPQPVWVSRPADILQNQISQDRVDLIAILAAPKLQRGEVYRVRAALANPSIQGLREAGELYPEWVTKQYLQLPDDLSPKLRLLAQDLSAGLETPYDKANAITNYLRNEIKYSTSINIPKNIADPLEYVVFDLKEGFCTYYASAEVLMLRTVGVPARMAVGYAQGELTVDESRAEMIIKYSVRRRDAHAWPEVYFPTYGWIEFEPTVNQDALERPLNDSNPSAPSNSPTLPLDTNQGNSSLAKRNQEPEELPANTITTHKPLNPYLLTAIVMIVFVIGILYAERKYSVAKQLPGYISQVYTRNHLQPPQWINNWTQWTELTSIERSFQTINISLGWLGASQPVHATPQQRANKLCELLPNAKGAIEVLEAEHRAELFTAVPGQPVRARRASFIILFYTFRKRALRFLGYN
jgi:transglutaminase-like putative cysteine protease